MTVEVIQACEETCQTPHRPFMAAIDHRHGKVVVFQPRCKKWSCPYCQKVNAGFWAMRAYYGCEELRKEGHSLYFLTLTMHERLSSAKALEVFPEAWKRLNSRIRYRAKKYQYLCIPEQHKSGKLHVHLIESAGLGTRFFKDAARACGMGYMADEKPIANDQNVIGYVVKYLVKGDASSRWPQGFRRVRASRNWPKLPELALPDWIQFQLIPPKESLVSYYTTWQADRYSVTRTDHLTAWQIVFHLAGIDEP